MLAVLKREIALMERHIKILKLVRKHQPVGIIKLANLSGMPLHRARYSLRVLERSGIIKPSLKGAVTTQKAEAFLKSLPRELRTLAEKVGSLAEATGQRR